MANVRRHLDIIDTFGVPAVVAVNRRPGDTNEEIEMVKRLALEAGAFAAEANEGFAQGRRRRRRPRRGGRRGVRAAEHASTSSVQDDEPIQDKIEAVAKQVYGAKDVYFYPEAEAKLSQFTREGLGDVPGVHGQDAPVAVGGPVAAERAGELHPARSGTSAPTPAPAGSCPCAATSSRCRVSARRRRRSTSTSTPRVGPSGFSDRSFGELLDAIAARTPAPGGGSSAACACAVAAALVEMAARFTPDREEPARRAAELRARALELAEIELHAYEPVLEALRLPRDDPERAARIEEARATASESPLAIAGVGAELAELAADIARTGNRNLAGDAIAGALLAEAAAQAAGRLVAINLTEGSSVHEAAELARRAHAAREAALS